MRDSLQVRRGSKQHQTIKKLIELRKTYDVITNGSYRVLLQDHPKIWSYVRETEEEVLLVINNFYDEETEFVLPENVNFDNWKQEVLISNYENAPLSYKHSTLRPYESIVYRFVK
jgi:trehalose-6-phosphate hydrolase